MPMFKMQPEDGNPSGGVATTAPIGAGPEAAVAAANPATEDNSEVNWDLLADDGASSSPAKSATPATPATPTPPAQPAAAQPQPPAQPTPPTQPTEPKKPLTQEEIAAASKAQREQMRTQMETIYAQELDDNTRAQLITEPDKVLPKLLAQAALDGANLAMMQLHHVLPGMIHGHLGQRDGANRAWSEFGTAHPDLAKPEYGKAVVSAVQMVKNSGQKFATAQDAMAAVARVVRATMGLQEPSAGQPAAAAPQPGSAPVAPHSPVARGGSAPRSAPKSPAPSAQPKDASEIDWASFVVE
jgi:hypothetical protein